MYESTLAELHLLTFHQHWERKGKCSRATVNSGFHHRQEFANHFVLIVFLLIKMYLQMSHYRWVLNRRSCSCGRVIDLLYLDGRVSEDEAGIGGRRCAEALLTAAWRQLLNASKLNLPSLFWEWNYHSHCCLFSSFFSIYFCFFIHFSPIIFTSFIQENRFFLWWQRNSTFYFFVYLFSIHIFQNKSWNEWPMSLYKLAREKKWLTRNYIFLWF